jgi:multiple sugar transport system substrate-binding protein
MKKSYYVMKRCIITLSVLFALTLVTITACSKSNKVAQNVVDETKGEIVFWSWSEAETLALAERFNKVYPDIKIKFVTVDSANFLTKFQTALVSNSELPDVALQEEGVRGAMFALDCWENLEAAPYNFDRNIVFPQILPLMVNSRNEVIGVERELNPSGLLYKRPLALQYFGTDDPIALSNLISDWDKFIAAGTRIAAETNGKVTMFSGPTDAIAILQHQYADTIFDGNNAYGTKFFTYVLDKVIQLNKNGAMGKLETYSPAWNESFVNGSSIFYPCAPWTSMWILKPNDPDGIGKWGATNAPVHAYSFGGTAYGIPKNAKNKIQAWKFIEWATTTDDGIDACQEVVGAIVSRQATYAGGVQQNPDPYFNGQDPNHFLLTEANPTMKIRPVHQYDVILTDILSLVAADILNNPSITTEKAVSTARTELKNKLPASVTLQ